MQPLSSIILNSNDTANLCEQCGPVGQFLLRSNISIFAERARKENQTFLATKMNF